jgi:hypothetical protein
MQGNVLKCVQCFSLHLLQKTAVMDIVKRKQMPQVYKAYLCFHKLGHGAHVAELVPKRKRTQKQNRLKQLLELAETIVTGQMVAHTRN